jgi:cytoskeleton protein RodZ
MTKKVSEENYSLKGEYDKNQSAIGQILTRQRELLGLSIAECADNLRLSVTKISALETGDTQPFESEVFIRGHLKNYAKLLGLSEDDIMVPYLSHLQCADITQHELGKLDNTIDTVERWWLPYLVGAIIIVFWFILTYIHSSEDVFSKEGVSLDSSISHPLGDQNNELKNTDINPTSSLIDNSSITMAKGIGKELPKKDKTDLILNEGAAVVTLDNDHLHDSPAAVSTSNTKEAIIPSAEDANTNKLPLDLLWFTFKEDCWLEVVDVNSNIIFNDIQDAGTELSIKGQAPFSIVLGNISGTTLLFNGNPVELPNNGNRRTLRLVLDD